MDANTTFNLAGAASGTTDSLTAWLAYITNAAFTGESPTSVAVLGLGSTTDPNRAYIESLFAQFAAANGLSLNQSTTSTTPSAEYRYSSNTATSANTTFIAMTLANFKLFVQNYIIPNQAVIAANAASAKTAPTLGTAGKVTPVYTEVRTGTGSINLAASGTVDLTGGALTYVNTSGAVVTPTLGYGVPTVFQIGGSAVYTVGHIATPIPETLTDPETGVSVTIDPMSLLSASLFSNGQPATILDYAYGRGQPSGVSGTGIYLTDPVYLDDGGAITVAGGQDVLGRTDVALQYRLPFVATNNLGNVPFPFVGTTDTPWYVGSVGELNTAAINPQAFQHGLGALGGGNVTVTAGRDIVDVTAVSDASLATATAVPSVGLQTSALLTMGTGNVSIIAVRNIAGGRIDVASGTALVDAGRAIEAGTPIITGGLTTNLYINGVQTLVYSALTTPDEITVRIADTTAELEAGGSLSIQGVAALAPSGGFSSTWGSNTTFIGLDGGQAQDRYGFYSAVSALTLLANSGITVTNDYLSGAFTATPTVPSSQNLATPANTAFISTMILPASFIATSMAGNVNLQTNNNVQSYVMVPSAQGELALFAGGNIPTTNIGMLDSDPGLSPGLFSTYGSTLAAGQLNLGFTVPVVLSSTTDLTKEEEHNQNATHAADPEPVYIYAEGSIGAATGGVTLSVSKQARIYAGQDIVNMMFFGQNVNSTDITRIVAGRDIIGTAQLVQPAVLVENYNGDAGATPVYSPARAAIEGNTFVIGGPGNFVLEAGRNLGPFMTSAKVLMEAVDDLAIVSQQETFGGGIISVGNSWNPYLSSTGADLTVMFGVSKGEDLAALRDTYVAPGTAGNVLGGYSAVLSAWMQQNDASDLMAAYGTTDVTSDQAYAAFLKLPEVRQEVFLIHDVYFNELEQVDVTTSPSYQIYSRGYAAVNTLFPASYGYTANSLQGGLGALGPLVSTGNLDLRLAALETQYGGYVDVLGPGGRIIAGSNVATAAQAARRTSVDAKLFDVAIPGVSQPVYGYPSSIESIPAGYEGILTLRGGAISTFTDGDVQLNQSRIFTEQGGNILMWSSNGDLNAGQGTKTSANFPPIVVHDDNYENTTVDELGGVTGAGIATLETMPDTPPGDVYLLAPRGKVDFSTAGARVSGNLSVSAQSVANADNTQVGGTTAGIPIPATPNIAAQTSASNTAGSQVTAIKTDTNDKPAEQPSIIIVEFLGFGGATPSASVQNATVSDAPGAQPASAQSKKPKCTTSDGHDTKAAGCTP